MEAFYFIVILVGVVINGVIFGFFSKWLAGEKGRDAEQWFWLGFWFGIIALLVLTASPTLKPSTPDAAPSSGEQSTPSSKQGIVLPEHKSCPRCAETIKFKALVCHYCSYEFGEEAVNRACEDYIRYRKSEVAAQQRKAKEELRKRKEKDREEAILRAKRQKRAEQETKQIQQSRESVTTGRAGGMRKAPKRGRLV